MNGKISVYFVIPTGAFILQNIPEGSKLQRYSKGLIINGRVLHKDYIIQPGDRITVQ